MTVELNSLAAKCEELALEVQGMSGMVEEARSLRARVAKLEETSKKRVSKVRA